MPKGSKEGRRAGAVRTGEVVTRGGSDEAVMQRALAECVRREPRCSISYTYRDGSQRVEHYVGSGVAE